MATNIGQDLNGQGGGYDTQSAKTPRIKPKLANPPPKVGDIPQVPGMPVGDHPEASPPARGGPPAGPPLQQPRDDGGFSIEGGPGRSAFPVAQQTAGSNVVGATPFMQTPGMQIASQRVSGDQVANDPAVTAALQDFQNRTAPQIQHRAQLSGLGRSTGALNAQSQAMSSLLAPMYESAFGREERRLGNLNTAAENELGRGERTAQRVSDANATQAQQLMQLQNQLWGQNRQAGQDILGAGGTQRDIENEANKALYNEDKSHQALAEQAVYAPFGGLAGGGLGTKSSTTGK